MPDRLPHQEEALDWMMDNLRGHIHLPTGSGKSRVQVEATGYFEQLGPDPQLFVVPNSLLEQTVEEYQTWLGEDWTRTKLSLLGPSLTLPQRAATLRSGAARVYLLSLEAMSDRRIAEAVKSRRWTALLVDEGSKCRNWTRRTRALLGAGGRSTRAYVSTGTPFVKTPLDIFYPTKILYPRRGQAIFGVQNKAQFITEYCLLGGWMNREPIGLRPDRQAQLLRHLDAMRFHRERDDIMRMPERRFTTRRVDLSPEQRRRYQEMVDTLRVEIQQAGDETFMTEVRHYITRMQRLQEIAAGFVRNTAGSWVSLTPSSKTRELIELLTDEPAPTIVWTWWKPEMEIICGALESAGIDHARLDRGGRDRFLSGGTDVLVAQMASGGYGLNLERADRMIYHSLPWDLEILLQSQDRNYRLTSTRAKHVISLVARGTIDERVREALTRKQDLAGRFSRARALEMLDAGP